MIRWKKIACDTMCCETPAGKLILVYARKRTDINSSVFTSRPIPPRLDKVESDISGRRGISGPRASTNAFIAAVAACRWERESNIVVRHGHIDMVDRFAHWLFDTKESSTFAGIAT